MLKIDDDVFVNIWSFVIFFCGDGVLKSNFYFGNLMYNSFVFCIGYYVVFKEDYLDNFFKDYMFGGGYVFLKDFVIRFI